MSRYDRSSRRASANRRRANSAIPGSDNLGWEHFGHPASSDQPSVDEYGFDSEFGEGVRKGPYRSGPAPASVGWMPDHPATSETLEEDYALTSDIRSENLKKANLRKAMERKAAKCIRIAQSRLGKRASKREVEELALRFMDLPNSTINARVARLADNAVQVGTDYEGLDFTGPGNAGDDLEADYMADDLEADYMADDLEADDHMAHGFMDEYDLDGDGMISREEWGGSESIFDAMDIDDDDFLSMEEIGMGVGESFAEMTLAEELAEEIATLKAANKRLANKVRKLADNAVQQGTDHVVEDFSEQIDTAPEAEPSEGEPTQRLAKIERLANALASFMGEEMADMGSLLAELEAEDIVSEEEALAEDMMSEDMMSEEMGEDVMGLDAPEKQASIDPRLASIFTASEEEDEEEEAEEEKAEEEETEEESDEIKMTDDEEEAEEEKKESKKASYRPAKTTRQASVKTLGNISRSASASDELSKLWESAPDVSKFFG